MNTPRKLVLAVLVVGLAVLSIRLAGSSRRGSAGATPVVGAPPAVPFERAAAEPLDESGSSLPVASEVPAIELDSRIAVSSTIAGSAILGTVVDPEERPIAGARVWLFSRWIRGTGPERESGRFAPEAALVTGADGRFRFAIVEHERRAVLVEAAGYAPRWRNQDPLLDTPFVLAPGARLYGSVAGAQVWARASEWDGASLVLTTEQERVDTASQTYEVLGLTGGERLELLIVPDVGLPFDESVQMGHAGDVRHDIVFTPDWIEGHVEDAVSGASVVGAVFSTKTPEGRRVVAESGLGGRFRLPTPVGDPTMSYDGGLEIPEREFDVVAPGYLRLVGFPAYARHTIPARIRLIPAGRIVGRVVLDDGSPAAGALVSCEDDYLLSFTSDIGSVRSGARAKETRCDAEGRFVLLDVLWGVHDMALDVRLGALERRVLGVSPLGPGTTRELAIRLGEGAVVQGFVRWRGMDFSPLSNWFTRHEAYPLARGAPPMPGARVTLLSDERSLVRETWTDACGAFAFEDLAAAAYTLSASDALDERVSSANVMVRTGVGGSQPLTLVIEPLSLVLAGRVRLPSGAPFASERIMAFVRGVDETSDLWFYAPGSGQWQTDVDGSFVLQVGCFPGTLAGLRVNHADADLSLEVPRSMAPALERRRIREGIDDSRTGANGPIVWTLPELLLVRLRLPGGVQPEGAALAWSGPDPGESGKGSVHRAADGLYPARLPAGVVDLELSFDGERIAVSGVRVPSEPVEGGALIEL